MSDEIYTLILSSLNSNNIVANTSRNSIQYFVNWSAILPIDYQKYSLSYTFMSQSVSLASADPTYCNIGINFGSSNIFDQTGSKTTNIGFVSQYVVYHIQNSPLVQYIANWQDNGPNIIQYPSNNIITVSILDQDNPTAYTIPNYTLRLFFKPIKTDNNPTKLIPRYTN